MATKEDAGMPQGIGTKLRRPIQIVRKRSSPLDDALNELHRAIGGDNPSTHDSPTAESISTAWQVTPTDAPVKLPTFSVTASSPQPTRRRHTNKEKEKKRERWLLTRKTWKYMTDAGRKLIPDGAQNRKEDISKIEAHFQHVCANETRFILWRRKYSYPGAMRNSKRRLKHLLQHTVQKEPFAMEALEQEEANNADQVIDLLQSYLRLDEDYKTTTLLSSKTVRPDQTSSPSARRPCRFGKLSTNNVNLTSRGHGFLTPQLPKGLQQLNEIDQLLERLRILSRNASTNVFTVPPENITPAILEEKALLKQVYNSLRKQQLHRVLSNHYIPPRSKLRHSSSLSSLLHFGSGDIDTVKWIDGQMENASRAGTQINTPTTEPVIQTTKARTTPRKPIFNTTRDANCGTVPPTPMPRQRKPPSTLDSLCRDSKNNTSIRRVKQQLIEKHFNSCGSQTNFIPLQEIKRLAEEYKERKREEATLNASWIGATGATDDETEKGGSATPAGTRHHRRKSSIDNEDVSQSVSDTIKRYLRMARKKSVHDDKVNRFKRVNYDRNLRNIKAKGEIDPPGMDEANSKAVQTLNAWPVISLDFIRGNEKSGILETAHVEWQRDLDERIQNKLEYARKLSGQIAVCAVVDDTSISRNTKPSLSSCDSSLAPASLISNENCGTEQGTNSFNSGVGAFRLAGSQFLSNLWHGTSGGSSSTTHEDATSSRNAGRDSHSPHTSSLLKFHRNRKSDQNTGHHDYAPGGTGKTFLICLLLAYVRSQNGIAVAIASYGCAAPLLDGGRTAHSVLKLPLNMQSIDTPTCNIGKGSGNAKVLQTCKMIVWDEYTLAHKKSLEDINLKLKDLRGNFSAAP